MEVVFARCCGLDVHKRTVVACLLTPGPGGRPEKAVRTFSTMTDDLLRLADWLAAAGCTHVAMESTGVFWQPIWYLLEDRFSLLLVNAAHIKAVPGRKTDVRDAEWIADLLRHGLLRGSVVPDQPQRELRDLTRYRSALVAERSAAASRLQKGLEGANIKLASVATDILGRSGRAMLEALVAGATDPAALAQLAKGRLRTKIAELERALTGRFGAHQRFLVARQLAHIDALDALIAEVSDEIIRRLQDLVPRPSSPPDASDGVRDAAPRPPAEEAIARLETIPGVGRRTAEALVAELGLDLRRFPTSGHLASWAGMCPGNHESAGKRQSGKTRKGNRALRAVLVEAAHAAGHTKHTYLGAQFRRVAARRGKKRAAVAVGHSILVIAYHLLTEGTVYQDLGPHYFDERARQATERRLVHRLEALGYKVALEPVAA
ncbi:MAG: IS110 family transposase [Chloroflexota bacterium]|nr:IS110 family transposase [Chloroflexota bacterium]